MPQLHEQITQLEEEIEALTESAERCKRVHLAAKGLVTIGAFIAAVALTGAFGPGSSALLLGMAAILGGIALLGSNRRTHHDLRAAIEAKAARRSELIDAAFERQSHDPSIPSINPA